MEDNNQNDTFDRRRRDRNNNRDQRILFIPPVQPTFPVGNCPDMSRYSCFTNYGWTYRNITANSDGSLNYTVCSPWGQCKFVTPNQTFPTGNPY